MSREAILDAAAQVIRQKGYHAASMADIADAVQLQKASLYHHFSSKQDILLELLDKALDMVIEGTAGVLSENLPADQKLKQAVRLYLRTLNEQGDLVPVLLLEHRSLGPEYHSRHIPHRDRFEQLWRDILQEGVDSGLFTIEDIPLTTRGLMGMMNWTITWYRPTGPQAIEEIADHFTNLFMNGLKK